MRRCSIKGCRNSLGPFFTVPSGRGPIEQCRRNKWLKACRLTNHSKQNICSLHFKDDDFEKPREDGRKKLKLWAVPSMNMPFEVPKRLVKVHPDKLIQNVPSLQLNLETFKLELNEGLNEKMNDEMELYILMGDEQEQGNQHKGKETAVRMSKNDHTYFRCSQHSTGFKCSCYSLTPPHIIRNISDHIDSISDNGNSIDNNDGGDIGHKTDYIPAEPSFLTTLLSGIPENQTALIVPDVEKPVEPQIDLLQVKIQKLRSKNLNLTNSLKQLLKENYFLKKELQKEKLAKQRLNKINRKRKLSLKTCLQFNFSV